MTGRARRGARGRCAAGTPPPARVPAQRTPGGRGTGRRARSRTPPGRRGSGGTRSRHRSVPRFDSG